MSNPSSPAEAGYYDTPGYAYGVAAAGACVYVADERAGVAIFRGCHLFIDGFETGDTSAWSAAVR